MESDFGNEVLLFDGVCNLCTGSVQFVIKHNPKKNIRFAALQSETGKKLLELHNLPAHELKSLVFIENGTAFTRSSGALHVARHLNGILPVLYGLIIIPRFIRDIVYDWVGKNRYRWFGKKNECWIPTPALKARFLD